ncbi:sugar kinase [Microbacterium sp.]|uniref:sugar kinase n=1 Tax=Microbacterium sp. TaxID=51671 RepID=UPI003A886B87
MPPSTRPTPRAVTLGEVLTVLVQSEPGPLEHARTFTRSLGGAEANVAIGLVAHGIPTSMLTRVGDDGFGRYIVSQLSTLGVGVDGICVDDDLHPTGLYIKEVGGPSGGDNDLGVGASRMHYYRRGSAATGIDLAYLRDPRAGLLLADADLIHTSGITPALSSSAAAAQRAVRSLAAPRSLISFDLNWRPALWRKRVGDARTVLAECMHGADIVLTGVGEAVAVFGTDTPAQIREAFPEPRWLIVKDDGAAVVAYDRDEPVTVGARRVDVVEATGAGDAFASGALAGIVHGLPLADAVQQGHDAAARVLTVRHDHLSPKVSVP